MEKNISTHLFTSALSQREQRLLFEFKNETEFQDAAKKLQEKLDNPEISTPAAQAELKVLEVSAKLDSNPARRAKVDELIKGVREREDADRAVDAIKSKTAKGNPEWDAIVKGVKDKAGDAAEQAKQLANAKALIAKSLGDMKTVFGLADKPYNYMKQIEAHNGNVVKTKGLDPANEKLSGAEDVVDDALMTGADISLKDVETDHGTYMLSLELLLKTAADIKTAENPDGRKAAEDLVDASVKTQKTALEVKIQAAIASDDYNAEKQVAAMLANMKKIDDVVNKRLDRKVAAPVAAPAAAVKPTVDADKTLSDKGIDAALVEALTGAKDAAAHGKALEALNGNVKVQAALKADSEALVKALNAKLEAAGSKLKIEVKDGKLAAKADSVTPAASTVAESKETNDFKSMLKTLLDFLKELAKELGMMRGGILDGKADPSKVTAANAPTAAIVKAEATTKAEVARTTTVRDEARARERRATTPSEKQKIREEIDATQKKLDELQNRLNRLKQEHEKSERKDRYVDERVSILQREAARRGAPFNVRSDAAKRSILIEARSRSLQSQCTPFIANVEREYGSAVAREKSGARIDIYNIQLGNNNVITNQATTGGVAVQAQGVNQRVGGETPSVTKEAAQKTQPAPSVQKEAAARPRAQVIKNTKATGSLE